MMRFLLVTSALWYCCGTRADTLTSSPYTRVFKSGPASAWVHPPSAADRERMLTVCPPDQAYPTKALNYTTTNPSYHSQWTPHSPPPRIIDGEGTNLGVYPYAATFTNDPTSTRMRITYCGATLISRWHLITVAHCAQLGQTVGEVVYVLLDGVCARRAGEDWCWDLPQELMRAVEIDFILTQYYYKGAREKPHNNL